MYYYAYKQSYKVVFLAVHYPAIVQASMSKRERVLPFLCPLLLCIMG